jgi:putative ABC transport system permease protein
VVKRRGEIAVLRALGVRDSEVRRAWFWESVILGLGVCGVAWGWALAQGSVRAVSQTVNALYYANNAEAAGLHPGEAVAAFLLAVTCSVVAGWLPSKRAAATPPAQLWAQGGGVLTSRARESARPWVGWGMLVAAVGLAFCPPLEFADGTRFALAGYWSALLGVVGAGMVAGDGLRFAAWLGAQCRGVPAPRQLANSHLRLPTSRHRRAAARASRAVSMTGGMSVLVGSFERSVGTWQVTHLLQADIVLTSARQSGRHGLQPKSAGTWKSITEDAAVVDWDALLLVPVELGGSSIRLAGTNLDFYQRRNQFSWLKAPKHAEISTQKGTSGCAQ